MSTTRGYAALTAGGDLQPFEFERREVGASDVAIDILYAGICHSDIHQVREEWGPAIFPMVPGHEIVGRITEVGSAVTGFAVGDLARHEGADQNLRLACGLLVEGDERLGVDLELHAFQDLEAFADDRERMGDGQPWRLERAAAGFVRPLQ